jgi:MraZ protein
VTRRTWVAVAAVTLILAAGLVLVFGRSLWSAEPPPPEPPEPPQPACRLPMARWPLGAPANREIPPEQGPSWSCPGRARGATDECVQTTTAFTPEVGPIEPPVWLDRPAMPAPAPNLTPLTGSHVTVLDGGLLTLPLPLRQQFGNLRDAGGKRQLFVMPGTDGCLWLVSAAGLDRLNEQFGQSGQGSRRVRQARRLCFAQTEACAVDLGGRLRVPDHLVRFAGLQQQVILVGVGDRVELWDGQRWHDYVGRTTGTLPVGTSPAVRP